MTLLIYDFDFNLKGTERRVISARHTAYYHKTGSFEVHLPADSPILRLLLTDKFLVARLGGKSAVIIGYELSDELVIYARTPEWLFEKRVIGAFNKTGTPGGICRELAAEIFGDSLTLGTCPDGESVTEENDRLQKFSDVLSDILSPCGLGYRLSFDVALKKWIFDIYSGAETGTILGEGFKNAYDTTLSADILDFAGVGVYMSGEEKKQVGTASGMRTLETILDAEDDDTAAGELEKHTEKSECSLYFRGGDTPELGSIVRVKLVRGDNRVTMKKRINGIETRITDGVRTVRPIFENI